MSSGRGLRLVLDATPLIGRRTGIGAYTANLISQLPAAFTRAGIDAEVAVTTWTARGARLVDLPADVTQVGPRVPARLLREAWLRTDHPRVETLVGRCDVVHGTNFVSPPTRRAREVVTVHDLTYELLRETVSADSLAYRTLVPRALTRGAQVVCPSQTVAAAVREHYGLTDDRVVTTPLGVDPIWFEATGPGVELRERLRLPTDYLVFVGSLDPRKNLPRLIEAHAAARAADPEVPPLVLAGPAGRDTTVHTCATVLRTGWLDPADLRAVVAGARALALPSLDEGFGLPVLEALACGRPVLCADLPVLHEVAGEAGVYADPTSVAAIAQGIHDVLTCPDDAAASQARRGRARGRTWQACADATVAAYLG